MYLLNLPNKQYSINLPESLKEAIDFLPDVVEDFNVANNYVLIALISECNLFALNLDARNGSTGKISTIPIIAKYGKITGAEVEEFVGQRAVIAPSDIEMGIHTNCRRNGITVSHVSSYIQSETQPADKWNKNDKVYTIDFKLVPLSAIKGSYNCIEPVAAKGIISNQEQVS